MVRSGRDSRAERMRGKRSEEEKSRVEAGSFRGGYALPGFLSGPRTHSLKPNHLSTSSPCNPSVHNILHVRL